VVGAKVGKKIGLRLRPRIRLRLRLRLRFRMRLRLRLRVSRIDPTLNETIIPPETNSAFKKEHSSDIFVAIKHPSST
jgi:hypothetical protein